MSLSSSSKRRQIERGVARLDDEGVAGLWHEFLKQLAGWTSQGLINDRRALPRQSPNESFAKIIAMPLALARRHASWNPPAGSSNDTRRRRRSAWSNRLELDRQEERHAWPSPTAAETRSRRTPCSTATAADAVECQRPCRRSFAVALGAAGIAAPGSREALRLPPWLIRAALGAVVHPVPDDPRRHREPEHVHRGGAYQTRIVS